MPEVGRVLGTGQVSLRISLLGVNEVRELGRVAQEEDWSVVEDPIHVAFLGLHLDGETTRVTSGIGGLRTNQSMGMITKILQLTPDSPPTVEKRTVTGHSSPSLAKMLAWQMSSKDLVHLNVP